MTAQSHPQVADASRTAPVFRRILLKLSGESLMGDREYGMDRATIDAIAEEVVDVHASGVEIALVVGAGNIYRGMAAAAQGMDRATADYAGMLNPFFTTDTAAALRALEIAADAILMAKHGTEGVYGGDPRHDPEAEFLPELSHLEAIERGIRVMDTTAMSLCMDNHLPIYVFALADGNIRRIVSGERVGTIITTPSDPGGAR